MTDQTPFLPPPELAKLVDEVIPKARHRAFAVEWQGEKVWIKITAPYNYYRWHKVQKAFSTLLGTPLLRPTVSVGGQEGLAFEFNRLVELHEKGFRVAKPIALAENWMATGHLGTPLQDLLDGENSDETKQVLLISGAKALALMHQKGAWHGSGQVRDLIQTPSGVGFIDFEEDLLREMSLPQAQARDVLLFLMSAARYATAEHNPLPAALKAYSQTAPENVWPELRRVRGIISSLIFLFKPWRQKLGRDARQALQAMEALREKL